MGGQVKQCDLLSVARRHFNRFGQILCNRIIQLHFVAFHHVLEEQCGKCLRHRADLENSVAVDFLRSSVIEFAGTEDATAAFIDQSNDHAGIGVAEVLTEKRLDGFGLGIGEAIVCHGQELGCQ